MRRELYKNIPNLLSFLRIPLAYGFIFAFFGSEKRWPSIIILAVSIITDMADGALARRLSAVTEAGKLIDPFADKFIELVILACLGIAGDLPFWLVALYLVKEIMMMYFGFLLLSRKKYVVSSNLFGKVATVIFYAIALLLLVFPLIASEEGAVYLLLCILAAISCVVSAVAYFICYKPILMHLKEHKKKKTT